MPVQDWSALSEVFAHVHASWLLRLVDELNRSILPPGYYALSEVYDNKIYPDVSTRLSRSGESPPPTELSSRVGLAEPQSETRLAARVLSWRGRRVTVHAEGDDHLVAAIELVSPRNKDRRESVLTFTQKIAQLIETGVHVTVIDILPPTRSAPQGIHAAIWTALRRRRTKNIVLPEDRPLVFVSYRAGAITMCYCDFAGFGDVLPSSALFLESEQYVRLPLEATYQAMMNALPSVIRDRLPPLPTRRSRKR